VAERFKALVLKYILRRVGSFHFVQLSPIWSDVFANVIPSRSLQCSAVSPCWVPIRVPTSGSPKLDQRNEPCSRRAIAHDELD
jgi:hypothetical protein